MVFWESMFYRIKVFLGPGFLESRFFRVQIFLDPSFSGSRFFRLQDFLSPGFSGSRFSLSFSSWLIVYSNEYNSHTCFFTYFLEYVQLFLDDNVDEECEWFSNRKRLASGCCLSFAWFFANFSLLLLIKVLLFK